MGGCSFAPVAHARYVPPRLARARDVALSRPAPSYVDAVAGAVPLHDGPPVERPELAIARAILHTNPRLDQAYALLLAVETARAARAHDLPPEFLGAALLQESAYDEGAISAAGAVGIAQFMPGTAAGIGIDPFDPFAAIGGAAGLLGGYVAAYRSIYAQPYATALAAYNAGPGAVERYAGVPPYPETREYVALIYDRWFRIVAYERVAAASRKR